MAKKSRLSTSSVQRIWRAFGLQPHRSETFKLSSDPLFIEKVRDVVGLWLNLPERAVALYENPRPFKWIRSADEIFDAVKRFCL